MQRIATTILALSLSPAGALAFPSQSQGQISQSGWTGGLVFPYGTDASEVEDGHAFIALRPDGSILAVGSDDDGLVSDSPVGTNIQTISCTARHALALSDDGALISWGNNWSNQVAGTPGGLGYTAISAGGWHSLAIAADGTVSAWGRNNFGQVSDAPSGNGFTQVSAGARHSVALNLDGSVTVWGYDGSGAVSNAPLGNDFIQVISYGDSSSALRSNGTIVAWGSNIGDYVTGAPTETGFTELVGARMARRADDTLQSWGISPPAPPGPGILDIAGEASPSIFVRAEGSGTAFCFGDGSGSACPCDVVGLTGYGCPHHPFLGPGANLVGYGTPQISQDSFGLAAKDLPSGTVGVILRGANRANGGLGVPLADGLLCTVGQSQRSQVQSTGNTTQMVFSHFNGQPFGQSSFGSGVPTNYQLWYRNSFLSCSGLNSNFSNAWEAVWTP